MQIMKHVSTVIANGTRQRFPNRFVSSFVDSLLKIQQCGEKSITFKQFFAL